MSASSVYESLRANAPKLAAASAEQRIAGLKKLLAATLEAREDIRAVVREELEICDTDIDAQLMMIKTEIEFFIKHLAEWMKPSPVQGSLMTLGKKSYIQYQPKGVVLNVATWNAPFAIGLVPAVGALAAGNAVLLKPSELAPASAALLEKIIAKAYGADTFAVVQGGPEVAQELLALPFNHIFYIGGHHVGRLIMKAAAEHLASVTLEMGGKNPAIVGASADVVDAAKKIAWGRLSNAGQICIAPDYVLVHDSVAQQFVEELGKAMTRMYNPDGKGFENSEEFGRVINARHFARVKALLDDAVERGARIAFGGQTDEASRYIAPTVVCDVSDDMTIMNEEIFGPAITVSSWSDREAAVNSIRARPKPLSSYVFARDRDEIDYFLQNTTSGNAVVNHNVIQSGTNPWLPFGGVNDSGIGRIGGHSTFLETSNQRSVVEEGPALMDPDLFFPPYADKYKKMVDDMLTKTLNVPNFVINMINGVIGGVSRVRGLFS